MKYFTYYHFILAMCDGFIRYFSITCLDISANTKNEDASTKPLVKWKCKLSLVSYTEADFSAVSFCCLQSGLPSVFSPSVTDSSNSTENLSEAMVQNRW